MRRTATSAAAHPKAPRTEKLEPPMLPAVLRTGGVFRYRATSALSAVSITWRCLQRLIFVNYGVSTGRTCLQSFRIAKLEAWAPPLIGSSYNSPTPLGIRVRTGDGALATERYISDVSTNYRGSHIKVKFPETTTDIGKWHDGAYVYAVDSTAFRLDGPSGTIIDLTFSFQLSLSAAAAVTLTTSSSMVGAIMVNYLDNTSTAGSAGGTLLTPVNENSNIASGF